MRKLLAFVVLAFGSLPAAAFAQDLQPPPPMNPGAPAPGYPGGPPPPGPGYSQPLPGQNGTPAGTVTDESKDSGIGLEWVWANAEAGASYINLKSFSDSNLAITSTSSQGGMFGFGAGARLLFLTIGARARYHTALNLWQINGEVGFHMKMGHLDPYFVARGGYDVVGSLSQSIAVTSGTQPGDAKVDVHGWNAGLGFGFDYYFIKLISIGGEINGDLLFLSRPVPPLPACPTGVPAAQCTAIAQQIQSQPLYQNSGSSVGLGAGLSAHLGIHF